MAVRPPEAVLDAVAEVVGPAGRSMVGPRWAAREQWHLTLQFLGPVGVLDPVLDGLRSAAASVGRFRFGLGGSGAFPNPRRARVIWIGAAQGAEAMSELAGAVNRALAPLGYRVEARPFSAHLTVARLKDRIDVTPALAALGDGPVGESWPVEEIVLYESRLSREGARYTALARFPLGH